MTIETDAAIFLIQLYQEGLDQPRTCRSVADLPGLSGHSAQHRQDILEHLCTAGMLSLTALTFHKEPGQVTWGLTQTRVDTTHRYAINAAGMIRAQELIADRDRPVRRYDTALNALVAAAADAFPKHRLALDDFQNSLRAKILDTTLTFEEIRRAVEYLEEHSLVTAERLGGVPCAITLTAGGRTCGWTDRVNVQQYLAGRLPAPLTTNWTVTVTGGAPQLGHGNTQNNTFGYDLPQVMQFAEKLIEMVRATDIPEPAKSGILKDAEALAYEAGHDEPQLSRIRRLLERLMTSLGDDPAHRGVLLASMALDVMRLLK
ncbi:hypothetical protein [Streptomyces virginiae]|uniref:hypothetical protein n=1 Tax=Streptomyces virginiae TaxID=1961 RepID=UPI0036EBFD0C